MTVSFGGLQLDHLGRAVLCEDDLKAIESVDLVSAGGTDGQTNSGECINSYSCNNTTNGKCTNGANVCVRANNTIKCTNVTTGEDQEEIQP